MCGGVCVGLWLRVALEVWPPSVFFLSLCFVLFGHLVEFEFVGVVSFFELLFLEWIGAFAVEACSVAGCVDGCVDGSAECFFVFLSLA